MNGAMDWFMNEGCGVCRMPQDGRSSSPARSWPPTLAAPAGGLLSGLDHRWRRACAAAGVEGITFHDLRHEATSCLFERGLSVVEVMSITGHSSLAMVRRYAHLRAADLATKLG
jgi:integrase